MKMLGEYLPPVLSEIKNIKSLMQLLQPVDNAMWYALETLLNNQFVDTADVNGVKKWEEELLLFPKLSDSLDLRKFAIKTKLIEPSVNSYRAIKSRLISLLGEDNFTLTVTDYTVNVFLQLGLNSKLDSIKKLLRNIIPANMVLNVDMDYNTHGDLSVYTHGELAEYTHYELRNEVLT